MGSVTGISPVLLVANLQRSVAYYEIYDAPPGFREFGVTDPDGRDIAFGRRVG